MPSLSRMLIVTPLLFLAACSQPDLAREEQAIRDIDARWLKARQLNDVAAEAALFANDGVAYRPNVDPLVGPAAYQAFRTKFQTDNPKGTTTWSTDAIRVAESGELAVQTGPYHDTALGPNGDREDKGRFVTVWTKVNGEWKVAHDIGSTASPDTAPAGWEVGSWKLNLAQSKFDPGPPPLSMTLMYEDRGDGVQVYTIEGIGANGRPFFNSYTFKYDGTQYPSPDTGIGTIGPTTNTYKRVDAFTVEITARERVSQKVTQVTTRTLSQDRKSMTSRVNGRPGQVMVFDRQ